MGTTRSTSGLSGSSVDDTAAVKLGSMCPGVRLDTHGGKTGLMRGAGKKPAELSSGYIVYERRSARLGCGARALAELPDAPADPALLIGGVTLTCTGSKALLLLLLLLLLADGPGWDCLEDDATAVPGCAGTPWLHTTSDCASRRYGVL